MAPYTIHKRQAIHQDCDARCLVWLERATEDQPRQQALARQAEDDVDLLAKAVLCPPADPRVLQDHVDREGVEEDEVADEYAVDETWDFAEVAT